MENENFYLHGLSSKEQDRLKNQARLHEFTIYQDIDFSNVDHLLEVGSGVGAQSEILLRRFPDLNLTGIDLRTEQIEEAKRYLAKFSNFDGRYEFLHMDATKMDFKTKKFDAAFLCWILEHIPNPERVLGELRRVLRPGGTVVISEVLNSSFFMEPYAPKTWQYWLTFNDFQHDHHGDPFIGAKLGNLLLRCGFQQLETKVKTWHFDNRNPEARRKAINHMEELLLSAAPQLIKEKLVTVDLVQEMKKELEIISTDPNAVFFYSFIQAQART